MGQVGGHKWDRWVATYGAGGVPHPATRPLLITLLVTYKITLNINNNMNMNTTSLKTRYGISNPLWKINRPPG
jgi:hypothetical protein